jgi:hypothetical protein
LTGRREALMSAVTKVAGSEVACRRGGIARELRRPLG